MTAAAMTVMDPAAAASLSAPAAAVTVDPAAAASFSAGATYPGRRQVVAESAS